VAPGHCSPSRKVVSKMTTRSLSDLAGVVMGQVLLVVGALISGRSWGSDCPAIP
jgi:hypothetical protein